jgi:L-threonylcarbamoyladenylate synthase
MVAIPTESTYGLAVDPSDARAVAAVLRVKGRPASQALPVVAGSIEDLLRLGVRLDLPELAPVLAAWPAPLTAVVPLARPLAAALGASTLAVRVPSHPRLRALLSSLGRAVTATSANVSGQKPAVEASEVHALLAGERAAVIEEPRLPGGAPSTIVAALDGRLVVLRQGRFPVARLFAARPG